MAQAEEPLIDTLLRLFAEKKINQDNAFDLPFLAIAEHMKSKAKDGFGAAGAQVEALQYLYGKRVDATKVKAEQLLEKFAGLSRHNTGKVSENAEQPQPKQRRNRKHDLDDDADVRLCSNEELSLPRDGRKCVLDNFLLEGTKERDGKIYESFVFKCPMYCGLVVGDAQPHMVFGEWEERPADPSLDLSGMLSALHDTAASLQALGENPFPKLKKFLPLEPDPVLDALSESLAGMSASVQCGPPPGAPRPPTTAHNRQQDPAAHQSCNDPCSSAGPAEQGSSCQSGDAAAAPYDLHDTNTQAQSPSQGAPMSDDFDAAEAGPDSQLAAGVGEWDDRFDDVFGGVDGGYDWGDVPLDHAADDVGAGMDGGPGEMSQAMKWLMQPQRADVPQVNLSWADESAWRFGQPPRDPSTIKKATTKAPATKTRKAKSTSICTGPEDEEHFPRPKAGKTYQLSAKKQEEMRQRAERVQREAAAEEKAPPRRKPLPPIDFEARYNAVAIMLADLRRPAEAKRNHRAAMEDGDLDAAALWADNDDGVMHGNHADTGGYCDYEGGDDWEGGYEDWSAGDNGFDASAGAQGSGGFAGIFTAGEENGGDKSQWGMLSPLAQNLAPAVERNSANKINYARRRRPVDAGKLKGCLWDSFVGHCKENSDDPVAATQQDTLTEPELAPVPPSGISPGEVNWQNMLDDVQDGNWGKVEDSSVHMCYFLTLVLANEQELHLRDAGSLSQGHRIMLSQGGHGG